MTEALYLNLDPDYRKDPDTNKPYCCRCQKTIKNIAKAICITVDYNTWLVTEGGEELIGIDCWKQIHKQLKAAIAKAEGR